MVVSRAKFGRAAERLGGGLGGPAQRAGGAEGGGGAAEGQRIGSHPRQCGRRSAGSIALSCRRWCSDRWISWIAWYSSLASSALARLRLSSVASVHLDTVY